MGDFNVPDVNWATLTASTSFSSQLCDLVFQSNLLQIIDCPTHIHGNVLDLVFTNCNDAINSFSVYTDNTISDHYLITLKMSFNFTHSDRQPSNYVYDFSKADYDGFCQFLLSCDLTSYYNCTDVNEAWTFIKQLIITGMDQFIPKVRLRSSQYPKWFNAHIRHQIKCLRTLRRKLRRCFSIPALNRLICAEDNLQSELQTVKSNYEQSLLDNFAKYKDPKIFHYIKSLSKSRSLPTVLKYNSISVETDKEKADMFNNYFFSVLTDSTSDLPMLPELNSLITDISINPNEVFEVLNALQMNKVSGADNIGPSVLKNCAASLAQPLHFLFSLSLRNGEVPSQWKHHTIIPVFKAGDKSSVNNYRPISLLSNISKVLERIVYNKIMEVYSDLISHRQFGFCRNKSTLQQLLLYFNDLCSSKAQKDCIYLDFSKAFDSVPHNKLLSKLWFNGITGNLWSWFRSYLTSRYQCVSVNGCLSNVLPVKSGVPQGSILEPLLFLIYINDLSQVVVHSTIFKFADDLKCYLPIRTHMDSTHLQHDLNLLYKWSTENLLSFKVNKCVVLQCLPSSTSAITVYNLDNFELSKVPQHKDLGIIFTTNLTWQSHYEAITAKAY